MAIQANYNTDQQPSKPSVLEVVKNYVKTPTGIQNMVTLPVINALKVTELVLTGLAEVVSGPKKIFQHANHLLFWAEYPKKVNVLYKSVVKLKDSLSSGSLLRIINKTTKVYINGIFRVGLVASAMKILHTEKLITLSSLSLTIIETIGFMSSFALFLMAMLAIKKQFQKVANAEIGSPQFKLALISLIGKVCLAVVAIFAMIAFFHATLISSWIVLGFSVAVLLFSVTTHFYEKIHVPVQEKSVAL